MVSPDIILAEESESDEEDYQREVDDEFESTGKVCDNFITSTETADAPTDVKPTNKKHDVCMLCMVNENCC